MYDNVSEIEQSAGPITSGHADAAPTYVHTLSENSTGGSTGPLFRIANLVAAHGVGRDVLYAHVRDNGYVIFTRSDGFQQIVADVRYYTIDDAWNLLTGAADGQWAIRDKPEAPNTDHGSPTDRLGVAKALRNAYACYIADYAMASWEGSEVKDAWLACADTAIWATGYADADESPAEIKRRMQEDGLVAPDEQGDGALLCHQRPFRPGDRVSWFDSYYSGCMGTLMWMQPRRGWFVQGDDGRNHANVHEDGMTLVEHATSRSDSHQAHGPRQEFQVRRTGQLWRDAAIIRADTIIRQDGVLHFAHKAKIVCSWVEADVEVRQLCDEGA